jgi:hypothetical protein
MDPVIYVVAAVLGLIPAAIARSKGRDFGTWWIFGALLFIVALPAALLLKPAPQPRGNAG